MKNLISSQALEAKTQLAGQQGFTLMETSIALVLMMVVGLGAASLFFFAVNSNSRGRDRELAMAVAQQQMEILRNSSFADLNATVTSFGGANKYVTSAGRQYSVVTTITNTASAVDTQKTIKVSVTPRGAQGAAAITAAFGGVTLITQRGALTFGANHGF